jgi:ATP-dependent DNA helicase RecG
MKFIESETLELKKSTSEIKEAIISIAKMVSERRNELIAEMLHRVHFIEKWGRGIKLILSKEPGTEFSEIGTKFITTFKRRSYFEGKKVGEKVGEKLTSNRQKIINLILKNKTITAKELSELVEISPRKVEENISWLKEKGLINRIGPDKGGYWEVVKK